ncbi:MAG: hypothetical protein HKN12_03860 [Gemmatimonadetes bacterium]|nr:hypothetical protein [Gemmatimonadota bacterium]
MSLPQYIERGGRQFLCQPYMFNDVTLRSFFVKGSHDKMQAITDAMVNSVLGETVYHVLSDQVVMLVTNVGHCNSENFPDNRMGFLEYMEVSAWIPVVRFEQGKLIPKIGLFSPYLWVNHPMALLAGREVFGCPKALADIQPTDPTSRATVTVDTYLENEYSPKTEWTSQRLLEIQTDHSDPSEHVHHDSMEDVVKDWIRKLVGNVAGTVLIHALDHELDVLAHHDLISSNLVFLKQFRDAEDGSKACYQSVVEAPLSITEFRTGSTLPGNHEVVVHECDPFPLCDDLGLVPGPQKVEFATVMTGDFLFHAGHTVGTAKVQST